MGLLAIYLVYVLVSPWYQMSEVFQLFGVWYMLTISLSAASAWSNRRVFFAQELCRPISRQDFISDVFSIRLRETVLLPIGITVVALLFALLKYKSLMPALAWTAGFSAFAHGIAFVYFAASIYGISIQRRWVIVLIGALTICGLLTGLAAIAILSFENGRPAMELKPLAMLLPGLAMLLTGGIVSYFARKRWLGVELAMLKT